MAIDDLKLFTGNANPGLSSEVAAQLGIGIGRAVVSTFSDGEANVEIMENVRGSDVWLSPVGAAALGPSCWSYYERVGCGWTVQWRCPWMRTSSRQRYLARQTWPSCTEPG